METRQLRRMSPLTSPFARNSPALASNRSKSWRDGGGSSCASLQSQKSQWRTSIPPKLRIRKMHRSSIQRWKLSAHAAASRLFEISEKFGPHAEFELTKLSKAPSVSFVSSSLAAPSNFFAVGYHRRHRSTRAICSPNLRVNQKYLGWPSGSRTGGETHNPVRLLKEHHRCARIRWHGETGPLTSVHVAKRK